MLFGAFVVGVVGGMLLVTSTHAPRAELQRLVDTTRQHAESVRVHASKVL